MAYRPWGLIEWVLAQSSPRRWQFVGALGTEKRSLSAWKTLRRIELLADSRLLEIHDRTSHHTPLFEQRLQERRVEYLSSGGTAETVIAGVRLLDPLHLIDGRAREFSTSSPAVVLDITSLPKRHFFPTLRRLVESSQVRDLVVTYTSPASYAHGEPICEQVGEWVHLPGFPPDSDDERDELLFVGLGFLVEGLQRHIASIKKHKSIHVLVPFPAPLAASRRTWEAVHRLESERHEDKFANYRIGAHDLAATFDRIRSLHTDAALKAAFAPFGPKPISAAMCLYAIQQQSCAVYYPQPEVYHPDYSKGVGEIDGKPAIHAYWIKHGGNFLYELPSESRQR